MRPVYVTLNLTIICALGIAAGWIGRSWVSESSAPGEVDTLASRFVDQTANELDQRVDRFEIPETHVSHHFEPIPSPALRFGIIELVPIDLTQFVTDQSASLRALLEGDTAVAIEQGAPTKAPY